MDKAIVALMFGRFVRQRNNDGSTERRRKGEGDPLEMKLSPQESINRSWFGGFEA
jgi:hypothetical protein